MWSEQLKTLSTLYVFLALNLWVFFWISIFLRNLCKGRKQEIATLEYFLCPTYICSIESESEVAQSCPSEPMDWSPLSMGFFRQEYWSELPFPAPGYLPEPGTEPESPAWQADSSPLSPWPRTLRAWTQWILNSRETEGWREEDGAEPKASIAAVPERSSQNPVSNSSSRGTACGRQKEFRLLFL